MPMTQSTEHPTMPPAPTTGPSPPHPLSSTPYHRVSSPLPTLFVRVPNPSPLLIQPPVLMMQPLRLFPLNLLLLPLPPPLVPRREPLLPRRVLRLDRRVRHHARVHGQPLGPARPGGREGAVERAGGEVCRPAAGQYLQEGPCPCNLRLRVAGLGEGAVGVADGFFFFFVRGGYLLSHRRRGTARACSTDLAPGPPALRRAGADSVSVRVLAVGRRRGRLLLWGSR